ncbi:MAG: radical SAM protein [Candidatus Cloacimonadaceae bacterium]|nr:radical SAM protein [Candidatus Cloacimonadota bacterium]MDY0127392.1 radical SAM protein [Candidatus Cloacimonadaceae bacterium]MCB5254724.1 radical SAM protein [Candidatus Cloacimonadota bacterium]MCK9178214.1 radical SAM protein [Candidatus Cloacimonadota bacterium]MCK9241717.1 radical SAM protein [Candidatus Cloacimonadota bacterium]
MIYPQLQECRICPRNCGVNRYQIAGYCGAMAELKINLAQLHYGEEPPISGSRGSGTIFFSHCNLRCVFCQNHVISLRGSGQIISEEQLLKVIFELQKQGAHNINLVTPTHYSRPLISVLKAAKEQGLKIPILWNSSAYEHVETLHNLKGLVDIYLPDFKYYHPLYAKKYSHAEDYPAVALKALKEMVAQTGFLQENAAGIATKGVLVRLLLLPNGLSGTKDILRLLADEFGTKLPLSLMAQYYPAAEAVYIPELNRGVKTNEYQAVVELAQEIGFEKVFGQELSCDDQWTPDFTDTDKRGV